MICVESIRKRIDFQPEVALILGSGLGDYADEIQIEQTINYTEIEGFPTSTVAGHKGRFVFGYVNEVPVVIMQGRVHFYEGYPMSDVVLPTRLMGMLGAKKLILTNAAGGANFDFKPGDFIDVRHDKEIQELANDIIEVRRCKELNWAILDYAALVCKTRNPLCEECVLNKHCKYYELSQGDVTEEPE